MDFKDKIKNIDPYTPYKTMFLTKSEQAQLQNRFKDYVMFDGGYSNPERTRAFISQLPSGIVCFKIEYNENFLTLTHQNILGSLLSLNVKREVIGDILAEDSCFFVTEEMTPFIIKEFTKIGNHPITLTIFDGRMLERKINLEEHVIYIDSLRLDLVVSKLIRKSRNEANLLIDNDMVQVNHMVASKATKTINENDVLSIRKYGRFILLDTSKTSKKNKIVLKYGKFI